MTAQTTTKTLLSTRALAGSGWGRNFAMVPFSNPVNGGTRALHSIQVPTAKKEEAEETRQRTIFEFLLFATWFCNMDDDDLLDLAEVRNWFRAGDLSPLPSRLFRFVSGLSFDSPVVYRRDMAAAVVRILRNSISQIRGKYDQIYFYTFSSVSL